MSVEAWMDVVEVIADALSAWDPDHAADYRINASGYFGDSATS